MRWEVFDAAGTRALLEEHGLAATCSLGLPADAAYPDAPDAPDAAERFLAHVLALVAAVGSPVLTGVLYGTLGAVVGRPPTETDYGVVAASLKRLARHAATLGVSLGLEPVNRYETFLVNTASQAYEEGALTTTGDIRATPTTLHVTLNPLATPRRTRALATICEQLNATQTTYPGTNLTLRYTVKPHPTLA